ncbi:MAG TPA: type II toxin-antitoxin system RelE/ParE family toxin [Thermoanaerobaculia bacterium]|nr:type II toxin-antitoxin system RelE/ParE family toxin [Thermoanaerobaculia bacterium]
MKYAITFAPEALDDLKRAPKTDAKAVLDGIELHLRHAPELVSKSRIKRLRALHSPQYRLRVEDWRVFYDVDEREVWIRGVVRKPDAIAWLEQFGDPS